MALSATDDFKTFLIKSSQGTPQQLKKRQKYEALPSFTKAGLYYQPNFVSVRQQGIPQRISACEILKSKGTRHFVNNDIAEAIQEYQKALSIFCFIENKNPRWRYEGIRDEDLVFKDQTGTIPEEKEQVRSLKLSLYLHLTICYFKTGDMRSCVAACEEALKLDPKNSKAYYYGAKALTSNESGTLKEYQKAEEYMKKACELEPDNLDAHQELARISKQAQKLQAEQATVQSNPTNKKNSAVDHSSNKSSAAREESKTSSADPKNQSGSQQQQSGEERSKYLDKYEEALKNKKLENENNEVWKMLHGGKNFNSYDYPLSYEVDPNAPVPEEIKELERFLDHRGKEILKIYEKAGKTKEAALFKKQLEHARAAKKQLEKIAALDFNRPTEHLKSVAEKFGLDLQDETIKNELKKIQAQNLKDIRAWIDGMSKQFNDKTQNAKETAGSTGKKEEMSKKGSKKAGSTNNYYINNNYYTTNIDNSQQYITNNQTSNVYHSASDLSQQKEGGLKKRYSDATDAGPNEFKHNLGKPDDSDSSSRILNILIITVAIILFAVTIIIQTYSSTAQPAVPTKEI